MITRVVTNAGDPLVDGSGTPQAGVKVRFTLVKETGTPGDGWDALSGERIVPGPVEVLTDENGEFSVPLWPTSRGTTIMYWWCQVERLNVADFIAPLADGEGTIQWIALQAGGSIPTAQQYALWVQVRDGVATKAILDSVAGDYSDGECLLVTNDPTPANNGTWRMEDDVWVQASFDRVALVETRVSDVELARDRKLPFADNLNNDFLRRLVRDIVVYGADPTHDYILSLAEIQAYRCRFVLKDLTTGIEVAEASVTEAIPDYTALLPVWKLTQGVLPAYSGVYAVLNIDWAQAITGTYNYTTAVQSGIHMLKLRSDDFLSDYLDRDVYHEIIKVGAGQTFTTLRAAVESLYDAAGTGCARACYDHQILIDLIDAGTYDATYLAIPEFVAVRGLGIDKTFINKEDNAHHAMLEMHYDTKLRDVTINSDTGDGGSWAGEYCIHSDDFNRASVMKNRRLRQLFQRIKMIGGADQSAWLFGCGVSSGQHIRFIDCVGSHRHPTSTSPSFGFHNTGIIPSAQPGLVELIGCKSTDMLGSGVGVLSVGGGNKCRLTLINSDFELVYQGVTGAVADRAADRYEWEIGGVFNGPVLQSDAGMIVLATTAGQIPGGTAAALIFGVVDELGRGDLCIVDGGNFSLGARLGDCTSVNKALTIGAQTYTFTANHTAQSNATIIALINAALTTHPVSEKNIQHEIYPDTGYTRRVLNDTGSTIPAGSWVKRTGVDTIALADGADDIYGFVYRDILAGLAGNTVISKYCHAAYISGAVSDGKFGVSAGMLDYDAPIKIGYVMGSIVTRYY